MTALAASRNLFGLFDFQGHVLDFAFLSLEDGNTILSRPLGNPVAPSQLVNCQLIFYITWHSIADEITVVRPVHA